MGYIFVLLLEKDKYYLDICNNPDQVQAYLVGERGPRWIFKYTPIKIVEIINPCDIFDLDKHTKRYMARYGLNNVRGGAYSGLYLSSSDKNHIDKEIFTALGMCMHCGSDDHISNECKLNNFSGQVKQVVHSVKSKLIDFKNKIKECVENYKNNRRDRKYNIKYNTLAIDEEERPMMIVDSPRVTREVYKNEYEEDAKNLKNIFNTSHIERLSDSDSLDLSSSPDIQISPKLSSPLINPPMLAEFQKNESLKRLDLMTSNDILGISLNSLLDIPEPEIKLPSPPLKTIEEIFHSFDDTNDPVEIKEEKQNDMDISSSSSPSLEIDHPLI